MFYVEIRKLIPVIIKSSSTTPLGKCLIQQTGASLEDSVHSAERFSAQ